MTQGPGRTIGRAEQNCLSVYIQSTYYTYILYDTTVYPTSGASKLMGLSHVMIKIKLDLIEKKKKKKKKTGKRLSVARGVARARGVRRADGGEVPGLCEPPVHPTGTLWRGKHLLHP